jgi:hypothetical protein
MLNKAEKNYSTTHKELLAVIFGLLSQWAEIQNCERPCSTQMAYHSEKS